MTGVHPGREETVAQVPHKTGKATPAENLSPQTLSHPSLRGLGHLLEAATNIGQDHGPSHERGRAGHLSRDETTLAGVMEAEIKLVKDTAVEVGRAEKVGEVATTTVSVGMKTGAADALALGPGHERDAGHAPGPETAGQGRGHGTDVDAVAVVRERDQWTSGKRPSRS